MTSFRTCFAFALTLLTAVACGPAPEEALLSLSPDRSSFDGQNERAILKIRAWEVGGTPAEGLVHLTAPVGNFIGGDEVMLSEGFATATYACSPDEEAACSGTVRLAAEWGSMRATTQVTIAAGLQVTPVEWEVVSTGTLSTLLAIGTAPDGAAWAVGERGTVLQLVDRQWRSVPSPVRVTLRALAFDAAGNPVIAGDRGVLLRWVSGALEQFPLPFAEDDSFRAVSVDSHGQVHLGSEAGVLSTIVGDELQPKLDLRTPILGMAVQAGEIWASGDGMLARFNSGRWSNLPMPLSARLTVVAPGRDELWLCGERQGVTTTSGVIVSGPSPNWRTTAVPEPVKAFTEVPGVAERFALTGERLYRQIDESKWEPIAVPARATVMTSRARGDLVLVGPSGFSLLRAP